MSPFEKLIRKYPNAEVVEITEDMDAEGFLKLKTKLESRQIEGSTVGVVWMDKSHVILSRRTVTHPGWALPGGRIEKGEDFDSGFLRELIEETTVAASVSDVLVIERKTFVAPSGEKQDLTLVFFEAVAEPGQTATTTDDAFEEGLLIKTFNVSKLPEKMITNDKDKIHESMKRKNLL